MLKDLSAGIDVRSVRAQIHNVGVEVEAMEKKIRESPLSDLYASLNAAINSKVVGSDSGELTLREALFQADAAIAVEAVKGNVDIIGSTDSDFHMLAGDAAVTISEIKFLAGTKKRDASLSCIKISCGQWKPIEDAVRTLHIPLDSDRIKKGDSPVLDGQPLEVRALIGVAIGCDANPGGIQGIGPASVRDTIKDIEAKKLDMYSALLDWMEEKSKKHSAKELEVLAQTIMYEPGNCTDEVKDAPRKYIGSAPAKISRYHEEFVGGQCELVSENDDVLLCTCKGVTPSTPHKFLRSEGVSICTECGSELCRFCYLQDESNGHVLRCVPCYSGAMVAGEEAEESTGTRGIDGMRQELVVDANVREAATASPAMVMDWYDEFIVEERIRICKDIDGKVTVPQCCSSSLDDVESILDFNLVDGGSFLRREELNDQDRRDALALLAALVETSSNLGEGHEKATGASKSTYSASPDLFVKMAEGSRPERTGYRLLNRGWRGAVDGEAASPYDATFFLGRTPAGELVLRVKGDVRASFKDQYYNVEVAITKDTMYACSCNCKVGASAEDRHCCVHSFVKLLQLVLVMFDGFGESALIEYAAHLGGSEPDLSKDEKSSLLNSIRIINSCSSTKLEDDNDCGVVEMLSKYSVGTERAKLTPKAPSKNELGPISELGKAVQPSKAANNLMEDLKKESLLDDNESTSSSIDDNGSRSSSDDGDSADAVAGHFSGGPDWVGTAILRDVLTDLVSKTSTDSMMIGEIVGHQALNIRRRKAQLHSAAEKRIAVQLKSELRKHISSLHGRQMVEQQGAEPTFTAMVQDEDNDSVSHSSDSEQTMPEKKKHKNGQWHKRCPVPSCGCTDLNCGPGSWHRIPPPETRVLNPGCRKDTAVSIAKKTFLHKECLRRLGMKPNEYRAEQRICPKHEFVKVKKSVKVKSYLKKKVKGKKDARPEYELVESSRTLKLKLVTEAGVKSVRRRLETDSMSKGNAAGRGLVQKLKAIVSSTEADGEIAAAFNGYVESKEDAHIPMSVMCDSVANAAGIDNGSRLTPSTPSKKMKYVSSSSSGKRSRDGGPAADYWRDVPAWERPPTVALSMPAREVKRRTGFSDMRMLLGYVAVVCNGNVGILTKTATCLTWLEEWMMHFQFAIGNSRTLEDLANDFKCSIYLARNVLKDKRQKVMRAREAWPTFLSHEEDKALRAEKWGENYGDKRVVMHDNTSAPATGSSDASTNRAMHSNYYGGPVAKGGVWCQLSGWIGSSNLWTGAVSDTQYLEECGILEEQRLYAEMDTASGEDVIPFTNITDKGYRCVMAAWKNGQFLLQPTFHRSDQKIGSKGLLTSATIASDRGGNERAVRVCKYSNLIKRGLQKNGDPAIFNEYWLTWSFQANFMYRPVL